MKIVRGFLLALAIGCAMPGLGAESSAMLAVDDGVVIAGRVDLQALRAEHDGEVVVVDLRTEAEGTPEEAAAAAALGLRYENIPVSSAEIDPAQVRKLADVLNGAGDDAFVVVHCASGNRAAMLWGAVQVAEGRPLADVREAVDGVLTHQALIDGLEAYAREQGGGADN